MATVQNSRFHFRARPNSFISNKILQHLPRDITRVTCIRGIRTSTKSNLIKYRRLRIKSNFSRVDTLALLHSSCQRIFAFLTFFRVLFLAPSISKSIAISLFIYSRVPKGKMLTHQKTFDDVWSGKGLQFAYNYRRFSTLSHRVEFRRLYIYPMSSSRST